MPGVVSLSRGSVVSVPGGLPFEGGSELSADLGGDVDVLLVAESVEEPPHLGVDPEGGRW